MSPHKMLISAIRTLNIESEAIKEGINHLDEKFPLIIDALLNCKGRLIITGIGKSAIVGSKIVASLNSTGTPSIFMHAADAIHGDLGMVQNEDIVLCISNSGNTPEITALIPRIKRNNLLIAITGNTSSVLAQQADFVINSSVKNEACPIGSIPSASTTLQMVLGDAITICLIEARGFTLEDFGKFHPGGAIGKKLFLTVNDLIDLDNKPVVAPQSNLKEVINEISEKRQGATAVLKNQKLKGVITDGDLRRIFKTNDNLTSVIAENMMSTTPKTIQHNELAVKALNMMRKNSITQIAVLKDTAFIGFVHIHDLLKEGIL